MSGRPPHRDEGDDDARLWRRATADTTPLRRRRGAASAPLTPPRPPAGVEPTSPPPASHAVAAPYPAPSPQRDRPPVSQILEHGVAPGIDARTLVRLKRGLIPPETQIDLHYCTQDEAHRRLSRFLATCQDRHRRCVLVITGKGFGADGRVGVLKGEVPRWLNEPPNRERVLAFTHATAAFGGEGALFVLLRRPRHRDRR